MTVDAENQPEIVAVASGKGGTGKTIILASLGYALQYSGHRVLFVDTDMSTDGLSLFVLGPDGRDAIKDLEPANTFAGYLRTALSSTAMPFSVNRGGKDDHGQIYEALVSGSNIYGDRPDETTLGPLASLARDDYRQAVARLFDQLRASNRWDYILVDTRGGFSFDTVDVCVLADYFFLVTEPNPSSFYQDKSLIGRIIEAGTGLPRKPSLRGVFVNKATEIADPGSPDRSAVPAIHKQDLKDVEPLFRNLIVSEFGLRYSDTYPIPLDIDAVDAYKSQRVPYLAYPGSVFSFATLKAFSQLMRTVTVQWRSDVQKRWNEFVDEISAAIQAKNEGVRKAAGQQKAIMLERETLVRDISSLRLQLQELTKTYDQAAEGEKARLQRDRELFEIQAAQNRTKTLFLLVGAGVLFALLLLASSAYTFFLKNEYERAQSQIQGLQLAAKDATRTTAILRSWLFPGAKFFTDDGKALDGSGNQVSIDMDRLTKCNAWLKSHGFGDKITRAMVEDSSYSVLRKRLIGDFRIPLTYPTLANVQQPPP